VGDAISQGYENTVSYFNGYYNAKRLFAEAEDEIQTAAFAARGKDISTTPTAQIPATAKQKLTQVIDKCSNILAFHPSSSLVDDALLLIGKSFYYQMEYLKADRKFAELLAQYPNSSLILNTQLWYARTQEKLAKLDESIRLGEILSETAHSNNDKDIEIQAHQLLGNLYNKNNQIEKAIDKYEKVISLSTDDEIRNSAQVDLGDVYFLNNKYEKAADTYLRIGDNTSDIYLIYYSRLQASIAYRQLKEYQKGLDLINPLIENYRFKDYRPALFLERANIFAASGRQNDAIDEYIYIDTTYARTDYAVQSAYELGKLYEMSLGNYQLAYKYYSEVNSATVSSVLAEGRRKYAAFKRYFSAQQKWLTADSMLTVLIDSTHKSSIDTLAIASADSENHKVPSVAAQQVLPTADSINVLKSIAAQEKADVFYDELGVPDSAFYWYNQSIALKDDHIRSPRILYILAELSRTNPGKKFPSTDTYYLRIDQDYTGSIYADEARRFLGKASNKEKPDSAAEYYARAEKLVDAREYDKAIGILRNVRSLFPNSPYAAKSEYTTGWLLENYLVQPESALAQYKRVVKNYPGTPYAIDAKKRFSDNIPTTTEKKDTVGTVMNVKKDTVSVDIKVQKSKQIGIDEGEFKDRMNRLHPRPKDSVERKDIE
jgi:tetratricopeptide (TPR) repeat protein